jgi:putative transposase
LKDFTAIVLQRLKERKVFPTLKNNKSEPQSNIRLAAGSCQRTGARIEFTDGFKAGSFKLWGTRNLHYYQLDQIKRVRVVRAT